MREIAAHAAALDRDLGRGPGGARVRVTEAHVRLDEVQIACTRGQPVGVLPNRDQASFISRSVSQ